MRISLSFSTERAAIAEPVNAALSIVLAGVALLGVLVGSKPSRQAGHVAAAATSCGNGRAQQTRYQSSSASGD